MDNFKILVKQYIELDAKIKETQQTSKKLKSEKDNIHDELINFMTANNIEFCNCENNVLALKSSSQLESLNKDYINSSLKQYFETNKIPNDMQKLADSTTEYLINNRQSTEKKTLKIQKKK